MVVIAMLAVPFMVMLQFLPVVAVMNGKHKPAERRQYSYDFDED